jgi:predicted pyridoxine 5'-phosphate oxidase superfamily flavin-nucleotide-binding protein
MHDEPNPWHAGELAAQSRSGMDEIPPGFGIRDFMPDQHRLFFAQLPFVLAGTTDEDGAPMATVLAGGAGFIGSPDPRTLAIAARGADPAGERLMKGAPIGLLGIELSTRRRNRANGRVAFSGEPGLLVEILQSFGNCPQYIHRRSLDIAADASPAVEAFEGLDDTARAQVAEADTFFVATTSGRDVINGGVDISHRGGPAGFVQIDGDVLTIPDYRGNSYFNTLGNLMLDPRAALLFVDFATGAMTQLQGTVEILWDDHSLPHAERAWRFKVARGFRRDSGLRQIVSA